MWPRSIGLSMDLIKTVTHIVATLHAGFH
jgi:hypothetical protein